MPKKQLANSTKDQVGFAVSNPQTFLLRFTERNFQRREIDEQSFKSFNKFVMILGKSLSKQTTLNDVEGFVMMIKTVFQNFQQLNRYKSTFNFYIQLLQICMQIFERAVSLQLSKQICCEFLQILWPLYESQRKEQSFQKMEQKFSKINMPKQLTQPQTMSKINQFQSIPQLYSLNKYQNFISYAFQEISNENLMKSIMKSFMNIQGQNYFDSILKILQKCLQQSDYVRFVKVFEICMCIGDNISTQNDHISILLPKILTNQNKIEFLFQVFQSFHLEKFYTPNKLFYVCLNILDEIFTSKNISQKSIWLIEKICKYSHIFKQVNEVKQQEKLLTLYNKVLQVLFMGKNIKESESPSDKILQRLRSQISKQKSNDSPSKFNKIAQDVQIVEAKVKIEPQQKKQQQRKAEKKHSLQALRLEEIQVLSSRMKKIFQSFSANQIIHGIIRKNYKEGNIIKQFMKLCGQNISHISSQCLQLIFSVYIPLISEQQHLQLFTTIKNDESSLMKVIKLRILQRKMDTQKNSSEEIFNNFYKQIHTRLVSEQGTNFDFLALTVLHQHINSLNVVIQYLVSTCLGAIQKNSEIKSSYFRCSMALLASIIDLHHNISIKLSYNKFKFHVNKLNNKFSVQDFLSVNEIKQNKLFTTGPRVETGEEKQQQLLKIGQFISKVFKSTEKLGQLINLPNTEQNSYYYMIIIQLCSVCMQKMTKLGSESQQIQSIIKIRKNNKYSLVLTIGNQLLKALQNAQSQEKIDQNTQVILLHLLIKFQQIFTQPTQLQNQSKNQVQDQLEDKQKKQIKNNQMHQEKLQQLSIEITKLIKMLGSQPKLQTLRLINKSIQIKQQQSLAQQFLNFSIDEIQAKKNKLKDFIKHFHIIKFYSEALSNKQILIIMIIKQAVKILQKIQKKNSINQEKHNRSIKPFRIFFDSKSPLIDEKQRKMIQTYIKIKILVLSQQKKTQNKINLEQAKTIIKSLEENHDEVSQLILTQQKNQRYADLGQIFKQNTNFIRYLLQRITNSSTQSIDQSQINILLLNFLKNLLDNNSNILDICSRYLFEKISNSSIISSMIFNRTKKQISILKQLEQKEKERQNSKQIVKKQTMDQSKKVRKFQKQQQKMLEQSKNIYLILAKILKSIENQRLEKQQNILKIIGDIFALDDYSNIFISIHIVRQILNILPILRCLLSQSLLPQLADSVFGYLMAIKQIYQGEILDLHSSKGLIKSRDESSFTIGTIINFFVEDFYSKNYLDYHPSKFNDSMVIKEKEQIQKQNKDILTESKQNSINLLCAQNQKKGCFKCLKCDSFKQLCINCITICHKDHPVVYVQPPLRMSKSCQCSEDICKINPNFKRLKQVKEKRKQRNKQYTYKVGSFQPSRTTMQQFAQRYQDYRDPRQSKDIRELREQRWVRQPREVREPRQPRQPRDLRDSPQYYLQFERQLGRDIYQQQWDDQDESYNYISNPRQNNQGIIFSYSGISQPKPPLGTGNPGNQYYGNMSFGAPNSTTTTMRAIPNQSHYPIGVPNMAPNLIPPPANLPNIFTRATDGSAYVVYGGRNNNAMRNAYQDYGGRISQQEMERIIIQKQQRMRRQKESLRAVRQREKQAVKAAILSSRGGFQDEIPQRFLSRNQIIQEQQIQQEQSQSNDKFQDQDYEQSLNKLQQSKKIQKNVKTSKNKDIYDQTVNQSYLLPIFMEMAVEMCQNKVSSLKQQEPTIGWHIKLANPITSNQNIVFSTYKLCAAKTFHTKLGKNDVYHESPAPLVSKTPIAVTDKFIFILSGPKISIHLKQQLLIHLLQKNENAVGYPPISDVNLHFQPHSISVGHLNMVCFAGLHNVIIYEFDSTGRFINTDKQVRHSINNNNINKIKLTRFGVFIGLSRQIRLLNHNLQPKAIFKMPDALVKQWCILENSPNSFLIYITISDGYVFYAEGNMNTSGQVNFVKKVADSRTNRPVGFFILAKKVEDCGTLMLSTFKDKSIGHSLGRLTNDSTLTDINYIKLNNQGLQPTYEKYNLMGLSDIIAVNDDKKQSRQLYIVTIYKEQNHDNFSLHRGLLGIIKIKQDMQTGFSKYETQILCGEEQKCEYFEVIWLDNKKSWFVLSLHEDGSLKVTIPNKISKQIIQKQLVSLKERKVKSEKHDGLNKDEPVANQPKNEENQMHQKLSKSIKQSINIKMIKESLKIKKYQNNQLLSFIQNSELLRQKDDYSVILLSINAQTNTKLYEIKLVNKKKISTGLCFFDCSDVVLPTRKIENTFQIGFTYEESLYFYAFGSMKIEVKKRNDSEFSRDYKNNILPSKARDRDDAALLFEQRLLGMGMAPVLIKNTTQIAVYGQVFEPGFKNKVSDLMKSIQVYGNKNTPFELTEQQRLSNCLKNCNLFLANCFESNNLVLSKQQSQDFAIKMKQRLIGNKQKINLYNRLYPQIKKVVYKSLKVHEVLGENKINLHVFNDKLHPLRFATQTKIHNLYESLAKGQISDNDLVMLVNELYGFACGSLEQDVGAVNEEPQLDVLLYFLAKYPVLLYKLHKKIKLIENAKILYRLVPLYLFNYVVTKFLSYHNEWVIPALCEIVGKTVVSTEDAMNPKPSIQSRFLLYKYLKISQSTKLQAWLKNVEGIDALQCLKEQLPLGKQPVSNGNQPNSLYGGLGNFGLIGQFEMQDQQALLMKVMQLSKMDQKINLEQDIDIPIEQDQLGQQQERQMQNQTSVVQTKNVPEFIKDLIENCFKQVDYQATNLQQNCQKAAIIFVIFKLGQQNNKSRPEGAQDTLEFLCSTIQNVILKLCANYHEIANQNTHYILMMWLNLFGLIYQNCQKESTAYKTYQMVKEDVISTLNKFKIENVKKLNTIPNLFVRRIKGQKISTKADFIYGFISVLQKPCEANFVLLTLGCYWLFPHDKEYYNRTKYIETVRQNEKVGNIKKIYDTALTNIEIWKEVGDPEWLVKCVQEKMQDWPEAMELLTLYYE